MLVDADHIKLIEDMAKSQHLVSRYDPVDFIPTGSLSLDMCLGGGWARGRNQVISGQPNYGKTAILMMTAIRAIANGLTVCIIDTENNWELGYCERSGMGKPTRIIDGKIVEKGDYFYFNNNNESVGNIIRTMAKIGCDICEIDSATDIYSTAQQESDDFTYDPMMGRAKLLGRIVNLTSNDLLLNNMAVVWTSQWRESKDYGITRPGGKAFYHAQNIAVDLYSPNQYFTKKVDSEGAVKDIGPKDKGGNIMPEAMDIIGRTWKNKVSPNYRPFIIPVKVSPRLLINKAEELIQIGKELNIVVDKNGEKGTAASTLFFDGTQIAVGTKASVLALIENPEMADEIEKRIRVSIELRRQTEE